MISPVDQTTIVSTVRPSGKAALVMPSVKEVDAFVTLGGKNLGALLAAGSMQLGLVQGSGFCGAILFNVQQQPERALISPEELSVSMVAKLLEEAPDE
jgi:hypothetical protein